MALDLEFDTVLEMSSAASKISTVKSSLPFPAELATELI
jgi:hypothetical protein